MIDQRPRVLDTLFDHLLDMAVLGLCLLSIKPRWLVLIGTFGGQNSLELLKGLKYITPCPASLYLLILETGVKA